LNAKHTIWITGLSRSGKTTLANGLASRLREQGQRVQILDGREVRDELGDFFGFSKEERMRVSRVLCAMAKLLARHEVIPIVTSITPYQESRDFNRRELDPYLEIYVDCPIEVCCSRDDYGLYRRALRGDIKHVIGVDDPYEVPRNYDLRLPTAEEPAAESAAKLTAFVLEALGLDVERRDA
jgi:adenylylsulfate kinase